MLEGTEVLEIAEKGDGHSKWMRQEEGGGLFDVCAERKGRGGGFETTSESHGEKLIAIAGIAPCMELYDDHICLAIIVFLSLI